MEYEVEFKVLVAYGLIQDAKALYIRVRKSYNSHIKFKSLYRFPPVLVLPY
jgi:hypothetical protein